MGLLYPFPIDEKETSHVKVSDNQITLSTYGLPYIFWGYLAGYYILVGGLSIAIWDPAKKLLATHDPINSAIVYGLWITVLGATLGFTSLFFLYFKFIKKGNQLIKKTYLFGLPVISKTIDLKDSDSIIIEHFQGTPNVAAIQNIPEMKSHQNKGYYELFAVNSKSKKILIDRHSQKREIRLLCELLKKY